MEGGGFWSRVGFWGSFGFEGDFENMEIIEGGGRDNWIFVVW